MSTCDKPPGTSALEELRLDFMNDSDELSEKHGECDKLLCLEERDHVSISDPLVPLSGASVSDAPTACYSYIDNIDPGI